MWTGAGITNGVSLGSDASPPPNRLISPLTIGERIDPPNRPLATSPAADITLCPAEPFTCVFEFRARVFSSVPWRSCCCVVCRSDSCLLLCEIVSFACFKVFCNSCETESSLFPPEPCKGPIVADAYISGRLSSGIRDWCEGSVGRAAANVWYNLLLGTSHLRSQFVFQNNECIHRPGR